MFRTGIIGVGFIGAAHIEQLRRLGNVEVVALAEIGDAAAKAKALSVPKGYTDYKELIDTEKPDCIHICTPNNSHFEIAMYAMERGVHVLCEKPVGATVAEAAAMRDFAKAHGIVNGMNLNMRFIPLAYQMREMVRSGEVGDLFSIHGSYLQDWLFYETDYNWRLESAQSGASRAVADIGSHWLDLAEFVTGRAITEVSADFATFHKTRKKPRKPVETYSGLLLSPEDYADVPIETEDYATVLFRADGDAHGSCTISQTFAGRKCQTILAVSGSKSSLYWDSEDSNTLWAGRRDSANLQFVKDPSILAPNTRRQIGYPGGHTEGYPDSIKYCFKAFYEALEKKAAGKEIGSYDFADFETGLREMRLVDAIVRSAKERRWVSVQEMDGGAV